MYLELRRPFILGLAEGKWKPTLSHYFLRLCHEKGLLKRLYTQVPNLSQHTVKIFYRTLMDWTILWVYLKIKLLLLTAQWGQLHAKSVKLLTLFPNFVTKSLQDFALVSNKFTGQEKH